MSSIIQSLVRQLHPNSIMYQSEVTNITWNQGDKVNVTCANGQTYEADHVVVTVSLGVLKKYHRRMFLPQLPDDKEEAIDNIGFGKVNKIFLLFDKPFWKPGMGSIKLGWLDSDSKTYDNGQIEWPRKIFGSDEVMNNANVLVAWISGEEAELIESLTDEELKDECSNTIRRFLGDCSIPRPIAVMKSTWCTNKYTIGSYSFPTLAKYDGCFDVLARPLVSQDRIPRVLFAGEATSATMYSTMNGARASGLREAKRLINVYQKNTGAKL